MTVCLELAGEFTSDESACTGDKDPHWLADDGACCAGFAGGGSSICGWHYARLASSVIGMPANARETGQVFMTSTAIRSKSCSLIPATFALTSK